MKGLLLTAVVGTALCMASCTPKTEGYTLNGTGKGLQDGDTLYLYQIGEDDFLPVDTTVVANGKFQFTGAADSLDGIRYVVKSIEEEPVAMFFAEKGNITLELLEGRNAKVSGTPANDAYQAFNEENKKIEEEFSKKYSQLSDTTLTEEAKNVLTESLKTDMQKTTDFFYETIEKNLNNGFGFYLLETAAPGLEAEKLLPLIEKLPAKYANTPMIKELKEGAQKRLAASVGKKFIDFTSTTPDGASMKLSDVIAKNKYTLLDFWASWCGPCMQEMPNVVKVYNTYKSKGLEIVGLSLDADADAWKKAIKEQKATWVHLSDLTGWDAPAVASYGVQGIPATFLIDQEGTIVAKNLRGAELEAKIAELLK